MKKMFLYFFALVYAPLIMALNQSQVSSEQDVQGVYAAVLTPMHSDLSCDTKKLASHCKELMKQGCQGILLFGTTGEGPSFSLTERVEILQNLIVEGVDPAKIIVANGCSGVSDTVALGQEGLKQGCAAMLMAPPCFYKNVSDEGVLAYYREVIQKIDNPNLKVILYHIPQLSGVPLTINVIKTLRNEFPEIVVGVKESEGNLAFVKTILETLPGFKVFVANEKQIIEAIHLGAVGAICGIANLYPELICSLYNQGKKEYSSNPRSIEKIFEVLRGGSFIPLAKALMEKRQKESWHFVRPPLVALDAAQTEHFLGELQKNGLENAN